jgi:prophage antirepressor-like protein|nr:MAG TPA: repressor domain protein [Bacteriophage sp.]
MQELQIFNNPDFGEIRTLTIDDEAWFVGKDVAMVLGYSNPRKAMIDHVDEEDKTDGVTIRDSIGREQNPICINESGLYSLILTSKLESAKRFKRWVTSEVLPAIRKTGKYETKSGTTDYKQTLAEAKLNNSRSRVASLWLKIGQQVKIAEYQQICASYASSVLAGQPVIPLPPAEQRYYSAREIGELLGVSANRIGKLANSNGLKSDEYGKWYHDKSKYSAKEVDTFRYNDKAVDKFKELIAKE